MEKKDKIEIIIDKIKVCFWEHEDFDDIRVREILEQELDRAREEGRKERTDELKQAFHEVFYKSGELWFNYIFEDGDTKAEQEAKGVVEDYWDEIISKLSKKK